MSVGPLADLSGSLIVGPTCVAGGHCAMPGPASYTDYGPARAAVPDGSGGGNCCGLNGCGGGGGGNGNGGGGNGNGGPKGCGCCSCGICSCGGSLCVGCGSCPDCGTCGSGTSAPMSWQLGTGSLDGSGYNDFLSHLSGAVPMCVCCIPGPQPHPDMPPPALAAPAVPGSGSAFSQAVSVFASNTIPPHPNMANLWINCAQSGVTLWATCSGVTFYHSDNNSKTYTTQAGSALECPSSPGATVSSGSASAAPPNAVSIGVRLI